MLQNIQEEIEDKVIDSINSAVTGRIIVFKPEKKGLENYLAVERRGRYKEKEMYFQVNTLLLPAKDVDFVKDFSQKNFKAEKNLFLLFVYFDEIKQSITSYIWLIPSLQFRDIADVIKVDGGDNLLRFKSFADFKNKNKYSKFLVNIKDFGKLILDAFENKGEFDFSKGGSEELFEEDNKINLETLEEFLCDARKDAYALNAAPVDNPRLLSSKQMEFQKGPYYYLNIFFPGNKNIIGQEIIYLDLKPIWGMSYMGNQIKGLEQSFLKESLFYLFSKCRLGKDCENEKREYKYLDHGIGDLGGFSGKEELFVNDKSIYKLNYQGGLISDK